MNTEVGPRRLFEDKLVKCAAASQGLARSEAAKKNLVAHVGTSELVDRNYHAGECFCAL